MSQSIAIQTAETLADYRPVIEIADKSFKFCTYAGMFGVFVLQFTSDGALGKIAAAAAKLGSVRFIYRALFGIQDTIQLPGKLKESAKKRDYRAGLVATALVTFDILYVARGLLALIPATKNISSKIAPALPFFVIFLALDKGIATWNRPASAAQKESAIRGLTYLEVTTEVICTGTECVIGSELVPAAVKGVIAVTGMIAGASSLTVNAIRTWNKNPKPPNP